MKRIRLAFPVFLLPFFVFLCTVTLSAADKSPERKKIQLTPEIQLLRDAAIFRKSACSSALPKAIEHFVDADALGFLVRSISFKKSPAVWSYFFSGTVILAGNLKSSKPVVAFYNPFLDGVLLTQWTQKDRKSRLSAADLRIGSEMAGQTSGNPKLAWWLSETAKRPMPTALKEQYAAFAKVFAEKYPVDSDRVVKLASGKDIATVRATIVQRAAAAFVTLTAIQKPSVQPFSADLTALKKALRAGDAKALEKLTPAKNPMPPGELVKQPAWLRQHVVPMYAAVGPSNTLVLLAPVDAPRFYLCVEWSRKPSPHLEFLVPYDMDGTPLPAIDKAPK